MKTDPPNQFRLHEYGKPWDSTDSDGMNGAFSIPLKGFGHKIVANCFVSDGTHTPEDYGGWEHVSVHIWEYGKKRTPTLAEMRAVKEIFWNPEERVVQFHPPKSEYVNNHPHVLHLWKWTKEEFPFPPLILVGIKQTESV